MDLQGKKIAILLAQQYEDLELWYPFYRLKEAGAEVVLVGDAKGNAYPSKHGYPAMADLSAKDADPADFDLVIVPGGFSPDFMRRSRGMLDFIRKAADADMPIAAICHGLWMLCTVPQYLKGKRCTSWHSIRWDVQNAGGNWVDQEVVVEGNFISSRSPDDLPAFCREIINLLSKAEPHAGAGKSTRRAKVKV